MPNVIEGPLVPRPDLRFGIVVARFNDSITSKLLDSTLEGLRRYGIGDEAVTIAKVPGSFEIPLVAKELAASGRFDAIITLGCVIRGDTRHFEIVADGCAAGCRQVSLECRIPVIFAVLTVENAEQAADRAGLKLNRGLEAAAEAIEMANLMKALREQLT
ncbi:MAG TPA: 6,7-dimethyl-8-ribityllumazine synthase [Chloroflexota bacterium]|nr:6,7-dimethyl-8-ribityllumazine synthase [Chloroflexota bacterium]